MDKKIENQKWNFNNVALYVLALCSILFLTSAIGKDTAIETVFLEVSRGNNDADIRIDQEDFQFAKSGIQFNYLNLEEQISSQINHAINTKIIVDQQSTYLYQNGVVTQVILVDNEYPLQIKKTCSNFQDDRLKLDLSFAKDIMRNMKSEQNLSIILMISFLFMSACRLTNNMV